MKSCSSIQKMASLLAECGQKIVNALNINNTSAKLRKLEKSKALSIILPLFITFGMVASIGHASFGDSCLLEAIFDDNDQDTSSSYATLLPEDFRIENPMFYILADTSVNSYIDEHSQEQSTEDIFEDLKESQENSRHDFTPQLPAKATSLDEESIQEENRKDKLKALWGSLFYTLTEFSGELARKRKKELEIKKMLEETSIEENHYGDAEIRNINTSSMITKLDEHIGYERS